MTDDDFKQKLTPEQYHVLRERGTEAPGTGKLLYNEADGTYHCAACDAALFNSDAKYESTMPGLIGWPSFSGAIEGAVKNQPDNSLGMSRTESICVNCGSHLGHLFEDPTSPNGVHYCINSAALNFDQQS